jgi:branched-chain amino acid transport system ATP-binding protein
MSPVLSCRALGAGYGKLTVVRDFEMDIDAGSVVAVLGPNGSGKTTLMLTIAGLLARLAGEVLVDGRPMANGHPAAANRAGVVLVPDERALFTTLTVAENIAVASKQRRHPPRQEILEIFPALAARWDLKAGALSGGEQQMLALARAMVQHPRVLLIDEMSMGLAPVIIEDLLPVVRQLATEDRVGIVLVEQHVQLALEAADRAVVLAHGEIVLTGLASELATNPARLEAAYFGAEST